MESKFCSRCSEEKPIEEFNKRKRSFDGLQAYCRACNKSYMKVFNKEYLPKRRGGDPRETGSRLYNIWYGMRMRCSDPEDSHYHVYGGRGIRYCAEWEEWEGFKQDMLEGYDETLTLERKDVDGGYCKENCEWIPLKDQSLNRQDSLWITTPSGEKILFAKHCKDLGFSLGTAYSRYRKFGDNYEEVFKAYSNRRWSHGDGVKEIVAYNQDLSAKEVVAKVKEELGVDVRVEFIRQLRSDWKMGRESSPMLKMFGDMEGFYLNK